MSVSASKTSCVLITNKNSWVSEPVIKSLVEAQDIELKSVLFYSAHKNWKMIRKRLFQYGFSKFFGKVLDVVKNKLTGINSNTGIIKTSFQRVKFSKVPYKVVTDLNSLESIAYINDLKPDIVLVCSCSQIFKTHFLENHQIHFLNLHDSILPMHKGPSPSFWVLYNEEEDTAYSIHRIAEKIDSGEIIFQEKLKVGIVDSEEELIQKIVLLASRKIPEILRDVKHNQKIDFTFDNQLPSSYEGLPTLKQRKELNQRLKQNYKKS